MKRPNLWITLTILGISLFALMLLSGLMLLPASAHFQDEIKKAAFLFIVIIILWIIICIYTSKQTYQDGQQQARLSWQAKFPKKAIANVSYQPISNYKTLRTKLTQQYGFFWRNKVKILVVVGDEECLNQHLAELASKKVITDKRLVLVHGGQLDASDLAQLQQLKTLSSRKPVDGVVWLVDNLEQLTDEQVNHHKERLEALLQSFHYQVPLYLWQMDDNPELKQSVGCYVGLGAQAPELHEQFTQLADRLPQAGIAAMAASGDMKQAGWLLALSAQLEKSVEDQPLLTRLTPLLTEGTAFIWLRGLLFSKSMPISGWFNADWQALAKEKRLGQHIAPRWQKSMLWGSFALVCVTALGMLLSFVSQRQEILAMAEGLSQQNKTHSVNDQLAQLRQLQVIFGKLQYRAQYGTPLYQRFGLNQNSRLLADFGHYFDQQQNRLIRHQAATLLANHISQWLNSEPDSQERKQGFKTAYNNLKAYLMLTDSQQVDSRFLQQTLLSQWKSYPQASNWPALSADLIGFYADNLKNEPQWQLKADNNLVYRARGLLLSQYSQQQSVSHLYQQMMASLQNNYAPLGLSQLVENSDITALFTDKATISGLYTEQGWQEAVKPAIDKLAQQQHSGIDWVLTDAKRSTGQTQSTLSEQLTHLYLNAFSYAWLNFLNQLHWRQTRSLDGTVDQLSLLTNNPSPLTELIKVVTEQANTASGQDTIAGSLLTSASKLISKKTAQLTEQTELQKTFAPLQTLLPDNQSNNSDNNLQLTTFLNRVTQARLMLQQISASPDPQAKTAELAKTVLQGHSIDLTDTRDYGSLLAASLGQDLNNFGNNVFVAPLNQSWQQILQPAAQSINEQWQQAIQLPWDSAFVGRYPLANARGEISLPLLGDYIRSNNGRITQFIGQQLSGVVQLVGNQWQVNPNTQGLTVNPAFLDAINQLQQLADILFANGNPQIQFDLMPRPVRYVARTTLTLDGQKLDFYNQPYDWQQVIWPNTLFNPEAMLLWESNTASTRLYDDINGTWAFIHLLDKAKVKRLDDSVYLLEWQADDGLKLTYAMRTQFANGPLALLKLHGFRMPNWVFLDNNIKSR